MRAQIAFLLIAQQELANAKKSGLPEDAMLLVNEAQAYIVHAIKCVEESKKEVNYGENANLSV